MDKSQEICMVTLDCKLSRDFVPMRTYGIETVYETAVEFQSTRTKKGQIYINCNDEVKSKFEPNALYFRIVGELRSLKRQDEVTQKTWMYLYIVPREVTPLDSVPTEMVNLVEFTNIEVYKSPQTRLAFDSNRPTTRFVCRVNRSKTAFSCIPFITWNNLAKAVMNKLHEGVIITGRGNMHSRMVGDKFVCDVCASDIDIVTITEDTTESVSLI